MNYYEKLAEAIPIVGGVAPTGRNAATVEKIFNGCSSEMKETITASIERFASSAKEAGLTVTVNNLPRTLRYMKRFYVDAASGEPGKSLYPAVYKGVSFNPSTFDGSRREWVMVVDFFSLMMSLTNKCNEEGIVPPKFAVLDASMYWVVNLLGDNLTVEGELDEAADSLIASLIESSCSNQFYDVYETSRTRNAYLRAIADQFPANNTPPVFTLIDVWKTRKFKEYLKKAMQEFCTRDEDGKWRVTKSVRYERYMPYSPWVTPLVAAELCLLGNEYGFKANLAPTSEAAWNVMVDAACKATGTAPYVMWSYVRDVGVQLPYSAIPFFSDNKKEFLGKLNSEKAKNSGLQELLSRLLSPFIGKNATDEEIYQWCAGIEREASRLLDQGKRLPSTPLNNMGWLLNFPPGIC